VARVRKSPFKKRLGRKTNFGKEGGRREVKVNSGRGEVWQKSKEVTRQSVDEVLLRQKKSKRRDEEVVSIPVDKIYYDLKKKKGGRKRRDIRNFERACAKSNDVLTKLWAGGEASFLTPIGEGRRFVTKPEPNQLVHHENLGGRSNTGWNGGRREENPRQRPKETIQVSCPVAINSALGFVGK